MRVCLVVLDQLLPRGLRVDEHQPTACAPNNRQFADSEEALATGGAAVIATDLA
jgi:hypothetical protein